MWKNQPVKSKCAKKGCHWITRYILSNWFVVNNRKKATVQSSDVFSWLLWQKMGQDLPNLSDKKILKCLIRSSIFDDRPSSAYKKPWGNNIGHSNDGRYSEQN